MMMNGVHLALRSIRAGSRRFHNLPSFQQYCGPRSDLTEINTVPNFALIRPSAISREEFLQQEIPKKTKLSLERNVNFCVQVFSHNNDLAAVAQELGKIAKHQLNLHLESKEAILGLYIRLQQIQNAKEFLKTLSKEEITPTIRHLSILLHLASETPEEVDPLFFTIFKKKQLDATITYLFELYITKFPEHENIGPLFDAFRKQDKFIFREKFYFQMANYYVINKNHPLSHSFTAELQKHYPNPSFLHLRKLIETYFKHYVDIKYPKAIFETVKQLKIPRPVLIDTYRIMIKGFCRYNNVISVLESISEMKQHQYPISLDTFNEIIKMYLTLGQPLEVVGVLDAMRTQGLWADQETYTMILDHFSVKTNDQLPPSQGAAAFPFKSAHKE